MNKTNNSKPKNNEKAISKNAAKKHYAYIMKCADGTFYCGYTTDPVRREAEHNSGTGLGAKCTRARRPVKLVYYESFDTRSEAMNREAALKKLSHSQKAQMSEAFSDGH